MYALLKVTNNAPSYFALSHPNIFPNLGRPPPTTPGQPLKIIHLDHDHVALDEENLNAIFNIYGIRDLPVVMVSVAGKARIVVLFDFN